MNHKSILDQAARGEFAPHRDEAATMTHTEFAAKHQATVRDWGQPRARYWCVHIDGVDYLWQKGSGLYDGWSYAPPEAEKGGE